MSQAFLNDPVMLLLKLIRLSNSNTQFEFKVFNYLNILVWELQLDQCLLLMLNKDKNELNASFSEKKTVLDLSSIPLHDNFIANGVKNRQSLLADSEDLRKLPLDWQSYLKEYKNFIVTVPLQDDKTTYGSVLLLSSFAKDINRQNSMIIESIANELTIAIKNHILSTDTRKQLSILNALSDLGRTLSSTIEVKKVMSIIPQIASGVFLADGCTLSILDHSGRFLVAFSSYGSIPPAYNFERYAGAALPEGIARALARKEIFMGYLNDDPIALELSLPEQNNTLLSLPLNFQGVHTGSISLFNKRANQKISPEFFSEKFNFDDLELLKAINSMISGSLENSITFEKVQELAYSKDQMVAFLSSLYDISSAMMTTVELNELIWIIMKSLTSPLGFNFDKAILLTLNKNEGGNYLSALAYWSQADSHDFPEALSLAEILKNPIKEQAIEMIEKGEALGLQIPESSNSIFSRSAIEKKPMLGVRTANSPEALNLAVFGVNIYGVIPMMVKGQAVGVIAVDRSFSQKSLTEDDLKKLTMMANQVGLALENTKLYEDIKSANQSLSQLRSRLIEAEKLAAQGELGAHLAHEIRNPLFSIGGFTQRLLKKMPDDNPLKKYVSVIMEEVLRLNDVLNNVLNFAKNKDIEVKPFKMENLLESVLKSLKHELARNDVEVITSVNVDFPYVSADDRQVAHILLNLLDNAIQAMHDCKDKKIYIKIYNESEAGRYYIACNLTDTGPGIPDDMLLSIFEPFTSNKVHGIGLGLSIVKKIINQFNGHISAINFPEEYPNGGASFTFTLPAAFPTNYKTVKNM